MFLLLLPAFVPVFKEMLQAPENAHRARLRKASDMTGEWLPWLA